MKSLSKRIPGNKMTEYEDYSHINSDNWCKSGREEESEIEVILNNPNNHPELSLKQVNAGNWKYYTVSPRDILLINLSSKYNNIRLKVLLFVLAKYNYRSRLAIDPDRFFSIRSVGI
jgi:hypothetical protein